MKNINLSFKALMIGASLLVGISASIPARAALYVENTITSESDGGPPTCTLYAGGDEVKRYSFSPIGKTTWSIESSDTLTFCATGECHFVCKNDKEKHKTGTFKYDPDKDFRKGYIIEKGTLKELTPTLWTNRICPSRNDPTICRVRVG